MKNYMSIMEYEEVRCKLCNIMRGKCINCPLSTFSQGCSPDYDEVVTDERLYVLNTYLALEPLLK